MPSSAPYPSTEAVPTPGWPFAVASGVLGWVLDAFDFFVLVFLFDTLALRFHTSKTSIVFTLTLTLALRPVGALLFGSLADRYGRRRPLIACVLYFSTCTILSGLAPTYIAFAVCRALYGIGMGGYWGIGASYALESSPRRLRGFLSGVIQAGYPTGYLLAAVALQTIAPTLGWRSVFFLGAPVALLIVGLTLAAPESRAWQQDHPTSLGSIFTALYAHRGIFLYLLVFMTALLGLSHGAQDLYPDFLRTIPAVASRSVFRLNAVYAVSILSNLGAIAGAILFGHLSQFTGRRRAIILALILALLCIPAWAFGSTLALLAAGAFLMQIGVQGAFGVIPAHLNELAPNEVRSLFPGIVYQLGTLLAAAAPTAEYALRDRLGYPRALTVFEAAGIALMIALTAAGPEARNRTFLQPQPIPTEAGK